MKQLRTILHVDDLEDDRLLLKMRLQREHLPVELHSVDGAESAMNYLLKQGDSACPAVDLLLLDIKMPIVDGFELLQQIRSQHGLSDLQVWMLSSSDDPGDVRRAKQLGANDYFVKESFYAELVAALRKRFAAEGVAGGGGGSTR